MDGVLFLLSTILSVVLRKERSGVENRLRGLFWEAGLSTKQLYVGRNVQFVGARNMKIGHGVTLHGNAYLNATGDQGALEIGESSHIDQFVVLYGQGGLRIGARCAIASGVVIYSQTNQYAQGTQDVISQPVRYAPVSIGDDVWIGASAVILPGVSIGSHSVVGAGAVVNRDVEEGTVVAGVPARPIGRRTVASS
jgi:acetyltransferase-like isoleucine patch superfamily enzyme